MLEPDITFLKSSISSKKFSPSSTVESCFPIILVCPKNAVLESEYEYVPPVHCTLS